MDEEIQLTDAEKQNLALQAYRGRDRTPAERLARKKRKAAAIEERRKAKAAAKGKVYKKKPKKVDALSASWARAPGSAFGGKRSR
ncbi:MAG: hypothetical protein VX796_05675 [Pseudomonadota bacterium]|nr:hypothetical protein [Pseudomonadota bacterium]